MTDIVIDASAGVDRLLDTVSGRALLAKLPSHARWWAPEHYLVEVAATLRRAELNGAAPAARVAVAFEQLRTGRFLRAQVRQLMPAAWALRGHLTFADALYVVLADQLGAPLVTSDVNLASAPGLTVTTITP